MGFEKWFEQYAPTAPECLDECARAAWYAGAEAEGCTVLKTMLEVFDIMANPTQFRSALAAAVAKRTPSNDKGNGPERSEGPR